MVGRARFGWWLLALMLAAGGCRCGQPAFTVLSARASVLEASVPGVSGAALEGWLREAINASPGLALPTSEASREKAVEAGIGVRLDLDLALLEVVQDAEGSGQRLEAGLTLRIRRVQDGVSVHDALDVLVGAPIGAEGSIDALTAELIRGALPALVERAVRQLEASRKAPDALVADLRGSPEAREAALRILVERRDPRAFMAVAEELEGTDPLALRRAIGLAVELGDRRAVPHLITLAQDRSDGALQEVLYAVGLLGGDEAQGYLATLASGHDSEAVRAIAEEALRESSR